MEANIYVYSTIRGPQKKAGVIAFILEAELPDGKKVTKPHFFRMEGLSEQRSWLLAVTMALGKIKEGNEAVIRGDSTYLTHGFENLQKWKDNNWKRPNGHDVKNVDLWEQIFDLQKSRKARFLSDGEHAFSSWLPWEAEKRAKLIKNVDFPGREEDKNV